VDTDRGGALGDRGVESRGREEETEAMGRLFVMHLEGKVYSCKHCHTHLGLSSDIISKSFHCKHGKAYLFNKV
jgi:hypothetical protein